MTVDELRKTAKEMGYKLMPISQEKLKACICGCKQRDHEYGSGVTLRCKRCGRTASGKTETEARKNWNAMIERDRA